MKLLIAVLLLAGCAWCEPANWPDILQKARAETDAALRDKIDSLTCDDKLDLIGGKLELSKMRLVRDSLRYHILYENHQNQVVGGVLISAAFFFFNIANMDNHTKTVVSINVAVSAVACYLCCSEIYRWYLYE